MSLLQVIAEHPIVLVFVATFLLVQLGSSLFFWRQLTVIRRQLQNFCDNPATAFHPNVQLRFSWLKWASDHIECNHSSTLREDVLGEFDRWILSCRSYMLLQRMAMMAPLLGVLITAGGFLQLKIPQQPEQLDRILYAITPLILGVGVGAFLAVVNQLLLYFADVQGDRARELARQWVDTVVTQQHDSIVPPSASVAALEQATNAMRDVTEKNAAIVKLIEAVAGHIDRAAGQLGQSAGEFTRQTAQLPAQLGQFMTLADSTLARAEPLMAEITHSFQKSIESFRLCIENDFVSIGKHHNDAVDQLRVSAASINDVVQGMQLGIEGLQDVAKRQSSLLQMVEDSFTNFLLPNQESMQQAVNRIDCATRELVQPLEHLAKSLGQAAGRLSSVNETAERLERGSALFEQAVEVHFSPATQLQHKLLESTSDAVQRTLAGAHNLEKASERLAAVADSHHNSSQHLMVSVSDHVLPAHTLLHRATTTFDATAEALSEYSDRFLAALQAMNTDMRQLHELASQAVGKMSSAGSSLQTVVTDNLEPGTLQYRDALSTFSAIASRLDTVVSKLLVASTQWCNISDAHSQSQQDLRSASQKSDAATDTFARAGATLNNILDDHVIPTQRQLGDMVTSLTTSVQQLHQFLEQGIVPFSHTLTELDKTLTNVRLVMETIRPLAAASQEGARFVEAMNQASQLAVVMSTLPERMEAALNGTARNRRIEESSKGILGRIFGG